MSASSGNPLDVLATPLGAVEGNVLIAGLESVAAFFVARAIIFQCAVAPDLPSQWRWEYSLWALFGLVALFLLGLIVEGIAGLSERLIVFDRANAPREWFRRATNAPSSWGPAQQWIWRSPQAASEFARRRLRILTARNSAVVVFFLAATVLIGLLFTRPTAWGYWWLGSLSVGGALVFVFGYLWVDANVGWNKAVREAGEHQSENLDPGRHT